MTVVHSFNGKDGAGPAGSLISVQGILYGTTYFGGANNRGAVFKIDPATGTETVLHSFRNDGMDGMGPVAAVLDVHGTLYGTTQDGGTGALNGGGGTVFKVDPATGAEQVVYSFCPQQLCADGYGPNAPLINVDGTLYSTTPLGGAEHSGTVFKIDPTTGAEVVVHSFNLADGYYPLAAPLNVGGALYGTTFDGRETPICRKVLPQYSAGCGMVFKIDETTGAETVMYVFCRQALCTDGSLPEGSLTDLGGALYSTTNAGGAGSCSTQDYAPGCGTVFKIDETTGAEKVVYSFQNNGTDGKFPYAGLIDVHGTLYGTTTKGGSGSCSEGCGTVFSVTPGGAEKILYSFCSKANCSDGWYPQAGLISVGGTLYGATYNGGKHGYGTVFKITP